MPSEVPANLAQMAATLEPFLTFSGRIASQYAMIEHTIDQAIWCLADVQPALGACITSQLGSTTARIKALIALLDLREGSGPLIRKINAFLQSNYVVADLRNRTVHDTWSITDEGEVSQICVALEKGKLTLGGKVKTIEEMNDILAKISKQVLEANFLYHEIKDWLSASPQKWRKTLPSLHLGRPVLPAQEI